VGRADDKVSFSALELFHFARTLRGCVYGNGYPAVDLPVLADHVRAGRLDVGALITDRIGLADIPAAFEKMTTGGGARSLVVFGRFPERCSRPEGPRREPGGPGSRRSGYDPHMHLRAAHRAVARRARALPVPGRRRLRAARREPLLAGRGA